MIFVHFTAVFWLKMIYLSDIQIFIREFRQQKGLDFFVYLIESYLFKEGDRIFL